MGFEEFLPEDGLRGTLLGRAWLAGTAGQPAGPSPVWISDRGVIDLASIAPTMAGLLAEDDLLDRLPRNAEPVMSIQDLIDNTFRGDNNAHLLAPVDLQAVKACGVTFASSLIERLIEERAGGDPLAAGSIRDSLTDEIGADVTAIRPGSAEADAVKEALVDRGLWSQYLEVGIGPYAEVFTKAQPMSSVGLGAQIGINAISRWNNPEPEVVLAVNPKGEVVGATLGNDVNLRDVEGRSALLLGKAKDNNASTAIGPFIRLFDHSFDLDDVRTATVTLEVSGPDQFSMTDESRMTEISRDVLELVDQTINDSHQYPDGLVLFTGTLFAPVQDRGAPGMGFTHKLGDVVRIHSPKLGSLVNTVTHSHEAPPWTFGTSALMANLAARDLL